jgi:hypothetical protein
MRHRMLRGLIWREWRQHEEPFSWIVVCWLIGVWILPIGPHAFLIPFGVIAAAILGSTVGGSDTVDGTEEFSFALPPTRSQRYVARLGLGGIALLGLLVLAIGAFLLDAPQRLWGLLFQSGYTESFTPFLPGFLWGLSLALPVAVFGETFAAGSLARSARAARAAWIRGSLISGALLGIGFWVEHALFQRAVGLVICPVLGAWGVLRLVWGFLAYRNKEGISASAALPSSRMSAWMMGVGILLVVLVLLMLMMSGVRSERSSVDSTPAPMPLEDK